MRYAVRATGLGLTYPEPMALVTGISHKPSAGGRYINDRALGGAPGELVDGDRVDLVPGVGWGRAGHLRRPYGALVAVFVATQVRSRPVRFAS